MVALTERLPLGVGEFAMWVGYLQALQFVLMTLVGLLAASMASVLLASMVAPSYFDMGYFDIASATVAYSRAVRPYMASLLAYVPAYS